MISVCIGWLTDQHKDRSTAAIPSQLHIQWCKFCLLYKMLYYVHYEFTYWPLGCYTACVIISNVIWWLIYRGFLWNCPLANAIGPTAVVDDKSCFRCLLGAIRQSYQIFKEDDICTGVANCLCTHKCYLGIFSCDQAALWMVQSVRPSVCLSVCHTFLTMFSLSYHHKIFRSYYLWQKWCPCKRSRS